jgi:hypothetical protein
MRRSMEEAVAQGKEGYIPNILDELPYYNPNLTRKSEDCSLRFD